MGRWTSLEICAEGNNEEQESKKNREDRSVIINWPTLGRSGLCCGCGCGCVEVLKFSFGRGS